MHNQRGDAVYICGIQINIKLYERSSSKTRTKTQFNPPTPFDYLRFFWESHPIWPFHIWGSHPPNHQRITLFFRSTHGNLPIITKLHYLIIKSPNIERWGKTSQAECCVEVCDVCACGRTSLFVVDIRTTILYAFYCFLSFPCRANPWTCKLFDLPCLSPLPPWRSVRSVVKSSSLFTIFKPASLSDSLLRAYRCNCLTFFCNLNGILGPVRFVMRSCVRLVSRPSHPHYISRICYSSPLFCASAVTFACCNILSEVPYFVDCLPIQLLSTKKITHSISNYKCDYESLTRLIFSSQIATET